jgi:hypothetical protein
MNITTTKILSTLLIATTISGCATHISRDAAVEMDRISHLVHESNNLLKEALDKCNTIDTYETPTGKLVQIARPKEWCEDPNHPFFLKYSLGLYTYKRQIEDFPGETVRRSTARPHQITTQSLLDKCMRDLQLIGRADVSYVLQRHICEEHVRQVGRDLVPGAYLVQSSSEK